MYSMEESPKNFEARESIVPRPNLLDIVGIEGRLAQVIGAGNSVRYLDDKTVMQIDWDDYSCEVATVPYVWALQKNQEISDDEYRAIHWDATTEADSPVKQYVTFFGRYKRK